VARVAWVGAVLYATWALGQGQTKPDASDRAFRVAELRGVISDMGLVSAAAQAVGPSRERVVNAIVELAQLRASGAAREVAELLDFDVYIDGTELPSPEQRYPAVRALIEIGRGVLPAVLDAVADRGRSEPFVQNAAYVLVKITGGKDAARGEIVRLGVRETGARRERLGELATVIPVIPATGSDIGVPRWETPVELREP
jgi:hypothetical protein